MPEIPLLPLGFPVWVQLSSIAEGQCEVLRFFEKQDFLKRTVGTRHDVRKQFEGPGNPPNLASGVPPPTVGAGAPPLIARPLRRIINARAQSPQSVCLAGPPGLSRSQTSFRS